MIRAVIFDMDGVLIESEPFWQEAEVAVFQTVGLNLTHEISQQSMGLRIDRAVAFWYERSPWPMPPTIEDIAHAIQTKVIEQVLEKGEPKAGVLGTLAFLSTKGVKLAIASSSYMKLIEAVVRRLDIAHFFDLAYSAEYELYGKPHPGVYITTAQRLGVTPAECLVIEDSLRGILAAKAAEMWCLAVPDPSFDGDQRLSIADWRLESLTQFDEAFWHKVNGQK